jgi:hypothetical protein
MAARMTLPPRAHVATALLAFVLPRQDVEAIIGDLEEEDASRSPSSCPSSRWYWAQIVRSIPPLLWLPIDRGGWRSTIAVALTACAIQAVVEVTTGLAVHVLSPATAQWPAGLALLVTLASLALVSYRAARIRAGAAIALAGVAAIAIIVRLALAARAGGVPVDTVAALLVVPATAFIGGSLSLRVRQR